MTTVLHVSDTYAGVSEGSSYADAAGGLELVVDHATANEVDAVVHTGNLFRRTSPTEEDYQIVTRLLDDFAEAEIPFLVIGGYREGIREGEALDRLSSHPAVNHLTSAPFVLDDRVAIYGIDYVDTGLESELSELETPVETPFSIVCLHQRVWPPAWEEHADISAYDATRAAPIHVDSIAAGGYDDPRSWTADEEDYRVVYPGATNRRIRRVGEPVQGSLLTFTETESHQAFVDLATTTIDSELEHIKYALQFERAELADAHDEELVDLYGLLARARKIMDERRQDVRDELLSRISHESRMEGKHATVRVQSRRRREPKDTETVYTILDRAGIPRDSVTTVDASVLRSLVDDGTLDENDVLDVSEQLIVRLDGLRL